MALAGGRGPRIRGHVAKDESSPDEGGATISRGRQQRRPREVLSGPLLRGAALLI